MDDLPEPTPRDRAIAVAHALAKGAVGAVPVAGSFLAEIIDLLYRQPIEQRREDWLNHVADAIEEIQKTQSENTPERLAQNPAFITVLHKASEIAIRTHQKDKHRLLRNALISAASPTPPEHDKQIYFLRLIEELTINHVLVLALYRNPKAWFEKHGIQVQDYMSGGRGLVLSQAYPDFAKKEDFQLLVVNDLVSRGLMGSLSGMVSGSAIYDQMTSRLANEFLDYVVANDE